MVTSRGSRLYLGTVTGLGVTALDAHPRGAHGCLAPTRVRHCWAFMGGTLLHHSLPGHYRGNVAERQRSPSWGGFAAPGARLEPPETLVCLSHDLSPKLWVPQGWPVDTFGIVSSVCTSRHVRTPWRDLPAPKVTVLPALVMGCAAQGSSQRCPRGGGTSAPASAPLHFSLPGSFVSRE